MVPCTWDLAEPSQIYLCPQGGKPEVVVRNAVQVISDNLRSSAYAFDKGITGLLGALAAPLVRAPALHAGPCNA